jgi:hypothetical protein
MFADNPYDSMNQGEQRTFVWKTKKCYVMRTTLPNALPASMIYSSRIQVNKIVTQFETDNTYVASVIAKYDNVNQDFQVDLTMLGQLPPVRDNIPSELLTQPGDPAVVLESLDD